MCGEIFWVMGMPTPWFLAMFFNTNIGSITLMTGEKGSDDLRKDLVAHVRKEIGPIASPDLLQFAPGLPKTRSGKIMRRILRKIAEDEFGNLGDTSAASARDEVSPGLANSHPPMLRPC